MNTLVVWADPRRDSFVADLHVAVLDALRAAGDSVRTIDLAGECYDPRMFAGEWTAYRAFAPAPDAQLADHVRALTWAQRLVFVFPTVAEGLPAVLKGWLERTMVPGVAFDFDRRGRVRGGLANVRSVVGVTVHPRTRGLSRLRGDGGRRTLCRALRMSCRRPWLVRCQWFSLYLPDDATGPRAEDARRAFRTRVTGRLSARPEHRGSRRRSRAVAVAARR